MADIEKKKLAVKLLLERNIVVSPDAVDTIAGNIEKFEELIKGKINSEEFLYINEDVVNVLTKREKLDANWQEFEKSRAVFEKQKNGAAYKQMVEFIKTEGQNQNEKNILYPEVNVLFSYKEEPKKIDIQDFVSYFNERYKTMQKMLSGRPELTNIMSITRILAKKEHDTISFIGIVSDKQLTKNQNIVLSLEDETGIIKAIVNKTKPELYEAAKDVVLDEVIGICGVNADKVVFVNSIVWPEIPRDKILKKAEDECYAVFLSDIHVGSRYFLPEELEKFLRWINCELEDPKQREIAAKVKYIFIVGDLVDGVGIYPGQEKELTIHDIFKQYEECARYLKQIPPHIQIIICAGNHDAGRISEPQQELYKDFAKAIWALPNITMVSNPALVNIHSNPNFKGFDVLIYHGYSFDYYVDQVDSIRNNGGYNKPDLIMKFLLKRRHLAPTHSSTLYMPDPKRDCLIINRIPDFFVTGHIHKSSVSHYRNVTMICGSCWQSKTQFQEKMGHKPEPCRVPIVNLQTRAVKILKFGD